MAKKIPYNEEQHIQAQARGAMIDRMRKSGTKWRAIAELLDISRARAQQIHNRFLRK